MTLTLAWQQPQASQEGASIWSVLVVIGDVVIPSARGGSVWRGAACWHAD
jgi:hypothetical protein